MKTLDFKPILKCSMQLGFLIGCAMCISFCAITDKHKRIMTYKTDYCTPIIMIKILVKIHVNKIVEFELENAELNMNSSSGCELLYFMLQVHYRSVHPIQTFGYILRSKILRI